MRKIEQEMCAAIAARRNWYAGNTSVIQDRTRDRADVFLHGNHIAAIQYRDTPNGLRKETLPNPQTFAEWPTATTRSRLRALGVDACIVNGRPHIGGQRCRPPAG